MGRASNTQMIGCQSFGSAMRTGQEVGIKHLTKIFEDCNVSHFSISKHDQPFQFSFPTNGKQYANDRGTDVSPNAPDSVSFLGRAVG